VLLYTSKTTIELGQRCSHEAADAGPLSSTRRVSSTLAHDERFSNRAVTCSRSSSNASDPFIYLFILAGHGSILIEFTIIIISGTSSSRETPLKPRVTYVQPFFSAFPKNILGCHVNSPQDHPWPQCQLS
jgi:hypothetical protein